MTAAALKEIAHVCGFELAGVAAAAPMPEHAYYREWVALGFAGEMGYLTGARAALREDPRCLLPTAKSVLCVGKLYETSAPHTGEGGDGRAWISRYAWGEDYHDVMRAGLERVAATLRQSAAAPFDFKVCVDTAPLLERALARRAGLGWIGKNTCLIHQPLGSWFFLGELLLSLELEPDTPAPDRCGTCTRCIDACPTVALVPSGFAEPAWALDSRRCISYFTIELRGPIPEEHRADAGPHVFGCDICQDVCPWNRRSPITAEPAFAPHHAAPPLDELAALTPEEFRARFRTSPVWRAKYAGFLRNVAVAMGNSGLERFRAPLVHLAASEDPVVAGHARWALGKLQ